MKVGINRDIEVKIDDVVYLEKSQNTTISGYDYGFAIGIARDEGWGDNDELLVQFPNGLVRSIPHNEILSCQPYEEFEKQFVSE